MQPAAVRPRIVATLGAAAAVLLSLPGAALARPAFGTVQALSSLGAKAWYPAVAADARGDAIVAWGEAAPGVPDTIYAAYKPAGGVFGTPQAVVRGSSAQPAPGETGRTALQPAIAMNASGAAVLAVAGAADATHNAVLVTRRPPGEGSRFGAPVRVSPDGQDAGAPQVAIGPGRAAVVAWNSDVAGPHGLPQGHVWAAYAAGDRFEGAADLTPPTAGEGSPTSFSLSVDGDGRADVVFSPPPWSAVLDATHQPGAAAFDPASAVATLPAGTFGVESISVLGLHAAVAPDGTLLVVYGVDDLHEDTRTQSGEIDAVVRPAGGAFGAPVALTSATGVQPYVWSGGFDQTGNALTAIGLPDAGGEDAAAQLQTVERPAGGTFGAPATFQRMPSGSGFFRLRAGSDGWLAMWRDGHALRYAARALAPGSPFGPPQSISGLLPAWQFWDVALDGRGGGVAVSVPDDESLLQAAYDAPAAAEVPALTLPAARARMGSGATVTLDLRADRRARATVAGSVRAGSRVVALQTTALTLAAHASNRVRLAPAAKDRSRLRAAVATGAAVARLTIVTRARDGQRHTQRATLRIRRR